MTAHRIDSLIPHLQNRFRIDRNEAWELFREALRAASAGPFGDVTYWSIIAELAATRETRAAALRESLHRARTMLPALRSSPSTAAALSELLFGMLALSCESGPQPTLSRNARD